MAVAGLVLPVSGPYSAIWNGSNLGTQNDDGFRLIGAFQGDEINKTDGYGMTLVEGIYRGINWRFRFVGLEFSRPGILAALQAFGSTGDPRFTFTPILSNTGWVGDRYGRSAQPLLLTALLPVQPQGGIFGSSGNPSFIATLTALNAIVAPQSNVDYLFTSKVREAPFEMVLLPYGVTVGSLNVNLAFTTT